ncbi:MAG: glycine cleavage system protein H [Deltaproteobacteria bacterium RBG_19FT_COMBO_52_11]|jgi:glycine cleavage system H protein|nr:MAG: glycine cleavage system protein H [Deltaproteobacteria bacterium RBG_19FT_COMBO_52_11]
MNFPKELKYSKDHEWARLEQEFVVVGITDYAQDKLGSIVFVELPSPEKSFKKGETLVTVDSVKAVAEVYAPVGGRVEAVNESLRDTPEWINRDSYGEGWMVKLKVADPGEMGSLLTAEAYEAFVREEEAKG